MSLRAFADRFLAAVKSGDRDAMSEMIHPTFELVEADSLPYGGTYRGFDGWLALMLAVGTAFAGFRLELIDYAGEGADTLVVHFAISGRGRETGTPFKSRVLEYWRFRDNKLARVDPFYFDTHLLVQALETAPALVLSRAESD